MGYLKLVQREDEKQAAMAGLQTKQLTQPGVEKHLAAFGVDAESASQGKKKPSSSWATTTTGDEAQDESSGESRGETMGDEKPKKSKSVKKEKKEKKKKKEKKDAHLTVEIDERGGSTFKSPRSPSKSPKKRRSLSKSPKKKKSTSTKKKGTETGTGTETEKGADGWPAKKPAPSKVVVELFDAEKPKMPSSDVKMFRDVTDAETKKKCKKLYKLMNIDPYNDSSKFDNDEACDAIKDYPDACGLKYEFEGFSGKTYPLSMLCALQASKDAVKKAYEAFPAAIGETDLWVGTPFHYAISYKGRSDVLDFLCKKDPKGVESTNYYGRTPLHMGALFKASEKSMKVVLKAFPRAVRVKDKEGYVPLHLACENGADASVIKVLVEAFPDSVHAEAKYSMTPLHFACSQNPDASVVRVLLVDGDPGVCRLPDALGHVPLHMALMGLAPYDVIELLVASAPDTVFSRNQKGELPLDIARRKRAPPEVEGLILKMMEKLEE